MLQGSIGIWGHEGGFPLGFASRFHSTKSQTMLTGSNHGGGLIGFPPRREGDTAECPEDFSVTDPLLPLDRLQAALSFKGRCPSCIYLCVNRQRKAAFVKDRLPVEMIN